MPRAAGSAERAVRAVVFVNEGAGGGPRHELVGRALAAAGIEAEMRGLDRLESPDLAGASVVVAAGGDGTVSAVAGVAVANDVPLGVLPLGTLNHFAKDAGIPLELEDAARVVAGGALREVDAGEVNGRFFVNNSSVGLYPELVRKREEREERLGKWPAMLLGALDVLRRLPRTRLRLRVSGLETERRTPILFVGNNRYDDGSTRTCLDGGELAVYLAHASTRLGLFRLAVRSLLGRVDAAHDLESFCVREMTVGSHRRSLDVALDGEVVRMAPPLRYRIHPRALRVRVPAE